MIIVYTSLFIIDSLIHLYASIVQNKKLRNITKVFILPFLIFIYITSTNTIKPIFIAALIFSWLGDIFLILKGHLFFSFGGISFGIAHVCFMITYYPYIHLNGINKIIACAIPFIYLIVVLVYFKNLKDYIPKKLFIPMVIYLLLNASMNCFALSLFISNLNIMTIIIYMGALLFFISDCNLFYVRFKIEEIKQNHFVIMFTYIIAELLIVLGIINI